MEFRDASAADADAIADVAAASLRESYGHFIDADRIDELVDHWYAHDRVADLLDEGGVDWLVATDDDDVRGFAQVGLLDTDPVVGEIHWLHVAPAAREQGLASQLLGRAQETLENRGATVLRGLVLAGNEDGAAFYDAHGFDRVDEREVAIDGTEYSEYVYEKAVGEGVDEPVVETVAGPDGDLFVNFSEAERGTHGPFYPAFRTRDLANRYGWYCSNCASVDTAMDSMGRIECNTCGNRRKATRWDASYL